MFMVLMMVLVMVVVLVMVKVSILVMVLVRAAIILSYTCPFPPSCPEKFVLAEHLILGFLKFEEQYNKQLERGGDHDQGVPQDVAHPPHLCLPLLRLLLLFSKPDQGGRRTKNH